MTLAQKKITVKPETTQGEVIVLPPVQVRRRTPRLNRHLRDVAQCIIPALLGLGLLVVA